MSAPDSYTTPRTDAEAMPARQWGDTVELVPAELARELERALAWFRLLAAEPHYIDKVKAALGPLSLWDQKSLSEHIEAKVRMRIADGLTPERGEGWISVKDRLPNGKERVVAIDGGEVLFASVVDGGWSVESCTADGLDWFDSDRVTHWMPLPSSPATVGNPYQDAVTGADPKATDKLADGLRRTMK